MGCIISDLNRRWPNNIIPFVINNQDFPAGTNNRTTIQNAINIVQATTVFQFVQRTTEPDFVAFVIANGTCSSPVGRQGNRQTIGCDVGNNFGVGNVMHEILHALGCWHEQSREDRNQFVTISPNNIQPNRINNFNQHINDGHDVGSYDYGSIMHYGRVAFSRNGQDTITPPQGVNIGQRNQLSPGDIATVNFLATTKTVLTDTSQSAPSLTNIGNRLFMVWRGRTINNIFYCTSPVWRNFSTAIASNDTTKNSPASAFFNGRLYVAWRGETINNIHICSTINGRTFSNTIRLNGTTRNAPALAVFNNRLYLAWRGETTNHIYICSSRDGVTFSQNMSLSDTTRNAPALATFNGRLFLAYRGETTNQIYIAHSRDSINFEHVNINEETCAAPCIFADGNNRLYIAWQAADNSRRIYIKGNHNGEQDQWRSTMVLDDACDGAPALSILNNTLIWAWKDIDNLDLNITSPPFPAMPPTLLTQLTQFFNSDDNSDQKISIDLTIKGIVAKL